MRVSSDLLDLERLTASLPGVGVAEAASGYPPPIEADYEREGTFRS